MFSWFTRAVLSQALAILTIVCEPAGHKKTASSEWGGNWKNAENELQNEKKTAATAFQSFRRAAGWVAPRIIHWWLIAFTVQNYSFLFRCNNLPVKNVLHAKFSVFFFGLKTRHYHGLYRFCKFQKKSGFFNHLPTKQ
jgi:hypothetical protein